MCLLTYLLTVQKSFNFRKKKRTIEERQISAGYATGCRPRYAVVCELFVKWRLSLRQTHEFTLNGEWELYSTSAEWRETVLSCCPLARYPYIEFALGLRRRYAFYLLNVIVPCATPIVPCALLSVLAMVGFCLPPDAGEKVSLGISVVLAMIVFLVVLAETVPRTSLHVPIIGTLQVLSANLPRNLAIAKSSDTFNLICIFFFVFKRLTLLK